MITKMIDADAERIAERLVGQCVLSMEQVFEEEEIENNPENCKMIDDLVLRCDICDWYVGIEDQSQTDSTCCNECAPDEEDEED